MRKATLLKGLCHKPPISAPVRSTLGRGFWLSFLPVSLIVQGFLRSGVLGGIWGRASDLEVLALCGEDGQVAEGQGVASPTAYEQCRR